LAQDANWHVTALLGLVDADGPGGNPAEWQVVERYIYDPFGSVTVLDAEWNERSSGSEYG
jgi:hypothetical protein